MRTLPTRLLAVLAAALLVLGACGDDDDDTDVGGITDEETTTTEEMETTTSEEMDEGMDDTTETTEEADVELGEDPAIVGLLTQDDRFTTLISAVEIATLTSALTAEGPFTLFAPTNEAFDALGEEEVQALLDDPAQLSEILEYHVVPGTAMAADLSDGDELETITGALIPVSVDGDMVMVGEAMVIEADLEAENGVVHVIDSVLMPPVE